jgi:hypothetical protein
MLNISVSGYYDITIESCIACAPDFSHAAFANERGQFIRADTLVRARQ